MRGEGRVGSVPSFPRFTISLVPWCQTGKVPALGFFAYKIILGKGKHSQQRDNQGFHFAFMDLIEPRDSL